MLDAIVWMLDWVASFALCSLTSTLDVGRWTLSVFFFFPI
jgi:hypothetical protein